MSWTEINQREGMPFGGMPYDVILEKLEETDPDLIDEVRGFDAFHDLEGDYDNYVRSEIIDWSPDAPFLESDHTRRDPSLSRSILNVHYNGTRGSQPELPRHPELFYGFTGNDPRGADNTPRFDQMRGHMTARAANLTVAMGDNDDHHLAERPWTGQAISYAGKELMRRAKRNWRWFAVQKEGRPWGRNVVADEFAAGDLRAAQVGDESFAYPAEGFYGAGPARFGGGDHGSAAELFTDGVRGVDGAFRDGTEIAPWRHTTGETDLGVQQYGQKRGAGRGHVGPGAVGGGRARAGGPDQDWEESRYARSTNRQVLGATMAAAARYRHAARSGRPDQDPGVSYELHGPQGAGLAPARDVAALYRHTVEDQSRRPAGELQDGDGGRLGPAAGLTPAAHPGRAVRGVENHLTPNGHLTNVESIVSGLREGTAASRRQIANFVVADGARHLAAAEIEPGARRGLAPGADYGSVAAMTDAPLQRSAAASGLEVHTYRSAPPRREHRAAAGRGAYDPVTWRPQHEAPPLGRSRAPGEWRSATQGQSDLGDTPDRVFGYDTDSDGYYGSAPNGPKSLRAGGWSDSMGLTDEVGSFSDGTGASA